MTGVRTNRPMRRKGLKHTKTVTAKGRTYVYFKTGQVDAKGKPILKALPHPDSPGFGAAYATMLGHKNRRAQLHDSPSELLVGPFIDLFEMSPVFQKFQPSTKRVYGIYLRQFRSEFPSAPAGKIERKDIVRIVDKRAGTPGAANLMRAAISSLYAWGRQRGHVQNDPCREIEAFEMGEHEPWPQDLLAEALDSDNPLIRRATHLLYYTAARIGDMVAFRWNYIRDGEITFTPKKTEKSRGEVTVPLHSALLAELQKDWRDIGPILSGPKGRARSEGYVREKMQAWALERGHEIVPHGLRKNAVNALLECGCSVAETASISQQTMQLVEYYAKKRNQPKLGRAAMKRWEAVERTNHKRAN